MIDFEEIRKHFGTFSLDSRDMANCPDFWNRILSQVLVTRCEHLFLEDEFVYSGFSMLFRPIEEGAKPLFYRFSVDEFNDIVAIETKEMEVTKEREYGQTGNNLRDQNLC